MFNLKHLISNSAEEPINLVYCWRFVRHLLSKQIFDIEKQERRGLINRCLLVGVFALKLTA